MTIDRLTSKSHLNRVSIQHARIKKFLRSAFFFWATEIVFLSTILRFPTEPKGHGYFMFVRFLKLFHVRKSYFENGKVKNLVCCLNISDAQHYMSLLTGSNQNSMYGEDKTISESRTQILPCNDNLQPRKVWYEITYSICNGLERSHLSG